ncbi:MAG TPA: hypothetical protein VFR09_00635 [Alphaproteobacteria bacterium]|nr:hypothetical protein [Alphaproteobacteria bacterium]
MTASSPSRSNLGRDILGWIISAPVIAIIAAAIWIAASSVVENMHFARATQQIIGVLAAAHDYAGREKNYTMQSGEDLVASLARIGTLTDIAKDPPPAHFFNPWSGAVQAVAAGPTTMRLETEVPVRDCRRLALFFAKEARSLGLQIMEARSGEGGVWRRFLNEEQDTIVDARPIEAACGDEPEARLALVFRLK